MVHDVAVAEAREGADEAAMAMVAAWTLTEYYLYRFLFALHIPCIHFCYMTAILSFAD